MGGPTEENTGEVQWKKVIAGGEGYSQSSFFQEQMPPPSVALTPSGHQHLLRPYPVEQGQMGLCTNHEFSFLYLWCFDKSGALLILERMPPAQGQLIPKESKHLPYKRLSRTSQLVRNPCS